MKISTPGLSLGLLSSGTLAATFNYSSVDEHCSDVWKFTGTEEAPTVVTNVTYVAANTTDGTPAFCDVLAQIDTYNGAAIRFPASGKDYAGIVSMQGCGGPCGYKYMDSYWADQGGWSWSRNLLQRGYLTATTDMGHLLSDQGGTAGFLFAYKNRTAEINFAYKATHQLVEAYKAMALEYYGTAHRMSLYRGSSTGGRQGLVSMQRYPLDFNGVVVGHPASNETAIGSIQETWLGLANKDPETGKQVLHVSDLTPLNQVALASCDHLDGLVDGLIDNADRCVIDWGLIDCQSPRKIINDTACFSAQKIKHAKLLYSNPVDSNGTELIHSSNLPGNELSWGLYEFYVTNDGVDHDNACYNGSISFNIGAAFENDFLPLDWKPEEYDWDNYPPKLRYMEQLYTGTNADLKAFKEAGGKFLMTQGWADYNVTPQFTIKYWLSLLTHMGPSSISDFARFFMMNGQYHTWGTGPGATSNLHLMDIMEQWVETGVAPEKIVGEKLATNGTVLFRRPSFPWPYFAWYRGGDVNDEASFEPRNRDYQL